MSNNTGLEVQDARRAAREPPNPQYAAANARGSSGAAVEFAKRDESGRAITSVMTATSMQIRNLEALYQNNKIDKHPTVMKPVRKAPLRREHGSDRPAPVTLREEGAAHRTNVED